MFIEAKDDGGGGDNWTTGAIGRAKLQSNHHHQQTNILFNRFSKKIDGKVASWPRKKRLDFAGNPDHVTLGSGQGIITVRWMMRNILRATEPGVCCGRTIPCDIGQVLPSVFF